MNASPCLAELHCHTCYSKDSLMLPERLLAVARRRGLGRLAITDHNTIAGALAAAALDGERVIIGEEVMTTEGELLAYYVTREIPCGLPPREAIDRLRQQGAFISVAHPFDVLRGGHWTREALLEILPHVDALEVFNARTWARRPNDLAGEWAKARGLLATAGSDAHDYSEVGRALMALPAFFDAPSMRSALASATVIGRRSLPWVHFYSRYASWRKKVGWRQPVPTRR